MIICEECGARNRNGAYVCEECGAGLLHLEATEDDFEPVKRKASRFGRKARAVEDEIPVYEEDEALLDEALVYEEDEPEEEAPVRSKKPLFGRKGRPAADELSQNETDYPQDETFVYEEDEPEEEAPVRTRRPLFGRRAKWEEAELPDEDGEPEQTPELRFEAEEEGQAQEQTETVFAEPELEQKEPGAGSTMETQEIFSVDLRMPESEQEPDMTEEVLADDGEPIAALRFEFEEPVPEETPHITYKEPIRDKKWPHTHDYSEPSPEEELSSITIDMEVQEFGDEDDDYEEEDSYREKSVYNTDFKAAYHKSRRGESDRMTRGMIAAIVTVSSLLVVTLVVLGVLLIGKNNRTAPVIATRAPVESVTPEATAEPAPSATPVPTTPPGEDYGSVFEQPADGLLPETDN